MHVHVSLLACDHVDLLALSLHIIAEAMQNTKSDTETAWPPSQALLSLPTERGSKKRSNHVFRLTVLVSEMETNNVNPRKRLYLFNSRALSPFLGLHDYT